MLETFAVHAKGHIVIDPRRHVAPMRRRQRFMSQRLEIHHVQRVFDGRMLGGFSRGLREQWAGSQEAKKFAAGGQGTAHRRIIPRAMRESYTGGSSAAALGGFNEIYY